MTAASASAPPPPPGACDRRVATGPSPWSYVVLIVGLVLMVGPFLWMLLGSLKPEADFLASHADVPAVAGRRPTTTAGCSTSWTSRGSSSTRRSSRSP